MLELLAQWTKLGQYWQEESIMLPWVSLTGDEKPITAAFVEAASIKAAALEIKADPINAAWRSQRRSHKGSSPWNKAGPIEAAFLNTMCSPQCFLHCLPQCLSTFAAALECPLLELPLVCISVFFHMLDETRSLGGEPACQADAQGVMACTVFPCCHLEPSK
mmetsp:Transcript_25186/g.68439  ORF Transcript_25186/g.68439 Transcript_25186/m.68439 type:complete len:162 (+) Transcript_25186:126-611(+)